jgi:hypothetical protein
MDASKPPGCREDVQLTPRAATGATLAPSEGLYQRICGESTTRGGERIVGRGEEHGLRCADPLLVAAFPCIGRPTDTTAERLNIGLLASLASHGLRLQLSGTLGRPVGWVVNDAPPTLAMSEHVDPITLSNGARIAAEFPRDDTGMIRVQLVRSNRVVEEVTIPYPGAGWAAPAA